MNNTLRLYSLLVSCFLFLLLPLSAYSSAEPTKNLKIEGRVFTRFAPLVDARVIVYKSFADLESGKVLLQSAATDANGVYNLELPPGEYLFTARGKQGGKEFMGYHGNNPIRIDKENVWLSVMTNEIKPPEYTEGPPSLAGIVTYKGEPVKDAYVAVYREGTPLLKGLGFRTESNLPDGTFNLLIPPGKFTVIAKKMIDKKRIRPLKEGDLYCYYPANPIEVPTDRTIKIEIPCYPKSDRTAFVNVPQIKNNDYTTLQKMSDLPRSGIKGKITDLEGKPVPGMYVMAHHQDTPVFMMFNISHGTEYVTETDKDGNYFIPIDKEGNFYMIARNTLGGGPHRGEIYGLYGDNAMHVVSLKKGELIEHIDIKVSSALDEVFLTKTGYKDSNQKIVLADTKLTDYSVHSDTILKGNIEVSGTLLVKRGVTLTIEPGTIVTFTKLDRDNNGIGDGELSVEGRIIAKGTKDKKIIFKSGAEHPATKDWAYILVLATASDNIFEYCDIQHAFTGMQIHYSNAKISDCYFHNNHEGLRFNRTNLVMEYTTFTDNDIAFRFARLEGRVYLRNNKITDNDVGALFMRPHVNTVDFNEPQYNLEPPVLINNSIYGNKSYNYKIGDRQYIDVNISNNWWGSADANIIADSIFDKNDDDILGQAVFEPFLKNPIENAGVR